jgi:hypothetical protein
MSRVATYLHADFPNLCTFPHIRAFVSQAISCLLNFSASNINKIYAAMAGNGHKMMLATVLAELSRGISPFSSCDTHTLMVVGSDFESPGWWSPDDPDGAKDEVGDSLLPLMARGRSAAMSYHPFPSNDPNGSVLRPEDLHNRRISCAAHC